MVSFILVPLRTVGLSEFTYSTAISKENFATLPKFEPKAKTDPIFTNSGLEGTLASQFLQILLSPSKSSFNVFENLSSKLKK
ncbi:hypothetical protein L1887_01714 [Cichorium endivia]|nr:hypothetical protein L1887_01714 [Cichorium endivia]